MIGQLFRRLRMIVRRQHEQQEIEAEIRLHLDLLEAQERHRGAPAERARAAARRRFGNPLVHAEAARDALGVRWLDDLRRDIRYALRTLARERRFTATALATLALGTGATTAIFSVISTLVLQPLPFPDPHRLVLVHGASALSPREPLSNLTTYREESRSFEALAGYEVGARYLRDAQGPDRVMAVRTEPGFFSILRVPAAAGRTYDATDPPTVAVISERFWTTRLGRQPTVVGSTIVLDGDAFTVLGVMPESFQFPYGAASLLPGVAAQVRTDIWVPFPSPLRGRVGNVVGRLQPGASVTSAQSEMEVIARRLEAADPVRNRGRSARVLPLDVAVVSPPIRRVLFLLFGAVALVLGLACANVANLFLGRLGSRMREVAIRSALGAGRSRIARQLLTEGVVLSLAGGTLGLALAWWGTARIVALAGPHLPRGSDISLDWRVFAFLFVTCTVTGMMTGLAPALLASRRDAHSALEGSSSPSTTARVYGWTRDVVVVLEVAAALVLAIGAAVLMRELFRLRQTESGMETRQVVTLHVGHRLVSRGRDRPHEEDVRPFLEIEDRVSRLSGVRAAGFTQLLPLQNWGWTSSSRDFHVRGEPPPALDFPIQLRYVTPGYFRAHGIAIVRGRGFTPADDRNAPFALVVNETLARRYFGSRDPVGAETTRGTVVGVAADVRQVHLDRPAEPEIYYTIAQNWSQLPELGMTLVVSTYARPEGSIAAIRAIVREAGPDLAVFNIQTMERVVAESLADFTLYLLLIGCFAALGLVLAVSGTYGVISYVAATRTREFAIRMALGADRRHVMRLMLGRGVAMAAAGVALGVGGAFAASPLLASFPVAVRRPDLLTIGPVAAGIAVVAVAASLVPARRAAAADPLAVLRRE